MVKRSKYCGKKWYYRFKPIDENGDPLEGYRQRMCREWLNQGPFGDAVEQRICDQTRTITKNRWLREIEVEMRKRRINTKKKNQNVEDSFIDSDELVSNVELNLSINPHPRPTLKL